MSGHQTTINKSDKLKDVCYDIRGPVLREAHRLEDEGHRVIKLNIGNPAPFGFEAPEELLQDVIHNLPDSTGYCHSKGLFPARKAVMQYTQTKGIENVTVDDIIIGNGVSELIVMAMQALLCRARPLCLRHVPFRLLILSWYLGRNQLSFDLFR